MSAFEDLLAAVRYLRDRTGDANAWQTQLSPSEVAAVITPTTRPEELEAILYKIRQQHSELFGGSTPGDPPATRPPDLPAAPSDREKGVAAEAIADAEAALAQQNSATSHLDMQVVSAILNAHLKTVDGGEALTKLQRETEAAVRTRSDLDTPAGARDFQRFLVGKLRDIRAVVLNASLDDTSKSALMAAWTALYGATQGEANRPDEHGPASAIGVGATGDSSTGWDPLLDSLWADAPGLLSGDSLGTSPTEGVTPPAMSPPVMPANLGTGSPSGPGATPGSLTGWSPPGGPPLPGLLSDGRTDPALGGLDDDALLGLQDPDTSVDGPDNDTDDGHNDHDADGPADERESAPAGPTTVSLPDGETVTAASPELAAAIEAAVGGAPIAEAFHQQGITLPAPGTAVADPIDPRQVIAGDIGVFTDRHALALGPGKALLDGQIEHIAAVSGPSFLGWEHPPAATATATAPAKPDTPTPTRPATSSTT